MYNYPNSIPEVTQIANIYEYITSQKTKPHEVSRSPISFPTRTSLSVCSDETRCVLELSALSHVASVQRGLFPGERFLAGDG